MAIDEARIKAEYVCGSLSYAKLAKKHGVGVYRLKEVGAKERWVDERAKIMNVCKYPLRSLKS